MIGKLEGTRKLARLQATEGKQKTEREIEAERYMFSCFEDDGRHAFAMDFFLVLSSDARLAFSGKGGLGPWQLVWLRVENNSKGPAGSVEESCDCPLFTFAFRDVLVGSSSSGGGGGEKHGELYVFRYYFADHGTVRCHGQVCPMSPHHHLAVAALCTKIVPL